MPVEKITIQDFLQLSHQFPVADVRSPGEYLQAHIPGAYSLPLFTDEERKVVGTAYKQQSKQAAIKYGLQYFGRKMVYIIEQAERIIAAHNLENTTEQTREKTIIVYCWRGGMRSAGIAWLLDLYGFKVYTLTGGYKSFRRWCTDMFGRKYYFKIIGGYTGSGKTEILKALVIKGHEVIDFEAFANHKGSAFGHLGQQPQPTQEMFENKLAIALFSATLENTIWIEDESRRIGNVCIPDILYNYIATRQVYFIEIPFEERLKYLIEKYGLFEKEKIAECIVRIHKRLGGMETKNALQYLEEGDLYNCFSILLRYYDKHYSKCLFQKKDKSVFIERIVAEDTDADKNADVLQSAEAAQLVIESINQ